MKGRRFRWLCAKCRRAAAMNTIQVRFAFAVWDNHPSGGLAWELRLPKVASATAHRKTLLTHDHLEW
jgi:hypothetical protein